MTTSPMKVTSHVLILRLQEYTTEELQSEINQRKQGTDIICYCCGGTGRMQNYDGPLFVGTTTCAQCNGTGKL